DLQGQIDFTTIGSSFFALAEQYLPSISPTSNTAAPSQEQGQKQEQDFTLRIHTHRFTPLAAFLSPKLMVSDSSTFEGRFHDGNSGHGSNGHGNSEVDTAVVFRLNIPAFKWGATELRDVHVQQKATSNHAEMELWAKEVQLYGHQAVEQLHIQQSLSDDRLNYQIHMSDIEAENHANLSGQIHFLTDRQLQVYLDPSEILLYGSTWQVSESMSHIAAGRSEIQGLHFQNGTQQIRIDGYIAQEPEELLHVTFDAFELSTIDPLILSSKLQINGTLHGQARIRSLLERPYAEAALRIEEARMDQVPMGRFTIHADYDQDLNRVNLAIDQNKENQQQLFVGGVYRLGQEEDNLDLMARFNQTELGFLGVILKDLVSDVQGSITGQATIHGTPRKLLIDGNGTLADAGFTVNYLQTPYRANGPIRMENTVFLVEDLILSDPAGHRAQVEGKIDMNSPTNPAIDAQINTTNFLVLQTDARDNPLYYGTAYGTGSFRFQGRPDAMDIRINARTEDQTVLNIPLNTASTLGNYEFIRFRPLGGDPKNDVTAAGSGTEAQESQPITSGLSLSMDLQVTPSATTNIFTELGELSGRGEGQISLGITSQGDFEMFGDYLINSGKFTFSAQDFINKIFEIKQGGQIRWTGKPTDATINLTAFYEQRTSLSPLYNAAGRTASESRVLSRAEMELNGNLMRPGINFGLDFPADPYVKDELQSYLSDANNVNQQALSLIVRRSFIPGSTSDFSRELNSTLLSAGTELAFNQLNNLISQSLNLNFFDLNIRSLNDASASLRFFDDRLIFTGGITDLRDQRLNDLNVWSREGIATDAELLYLIRKDGRLILRGSNRLNTRHFLLNPTDEYISALGLIYRQEFDSFRDFFRRKKD
ncbi:MAG TPA: translocation/assembly module TamB domain-containing protein, partial [Sphingobacteriaceae bacterium]|nr:translocation/assembly module TamB domain-containing protein [Sphingobacteriaceae bacterium]